MTGQDAPPGTTTIVVMGVSGSGKSTVADRLVDRLGWEFAEGDDFHPPENVAKMRAGHPLDDEDRWPWLRRLAAWIGEHEQAGRSVVVTCSALKRSYRDLLCDGHPVGLVRARDRRCGADPASASSTAPVTTCPPRCSTASWPSSSPCRTTSRGRASPAPGRRRRSSTELLAALGRDRGFSAVRRR